jgi:hypothetical protein
VLIISFVSLSVVATVVFDCSSFSYSRLCFSWKEWWVESMTTQWCYHRKWAILYVVCWSRSSWKTKETVVVRQPCGFGLSFNGKTGLVITTRQKFGPLWRTKTTWSVPPPVWRRFGTVGWALQSVNTVPAVDSTIYTGTKYASNI